MGFNTTVVVYNDAIDAIEKDPKFGANLAAAVKECARGRQVDVPAGNHVNAARVIESHHADNMHAVLVGGNLGDDLGRVGNWRLDTTDKEQRKALLRSIAARFGLKISISEAESG